MKTSKKVLIGVSSLIGVALIAVGAIWFSLPAGQRNMILFMATGTESYDEYEEVQVIDRNEDDLVSVFDVYPAEPEVNDADVNIRTVTEMVLNEGSGMLKTGMVDTLGVDDYTGWAVLADESGDGPEEYSFGPSPLSYYTSGLAANLHTQVIDAATVLDVEVDNVIVEVVNTFRWDDMSAVDGTGYLDVSTTNILIESDASSLEIQSVIDLALNGWAAGNALATETVVEPHLIINGDNFDTYNASPKTAYTVDSYVDDLMITSVTETPVEPYYLELTEVEDLGILDMLTSMNNLQFEIYAISESAHNEERPYLNEITVNAPSGETWVIYADEFMSTDDTPIAPTSLEYFTLGTSLCLTSQTTLVNAMMEIEYTDYRVEHMFEYSLEDVHTEDMSGSIDVIHTYVIIEADEDEDTLNEFFTRALSLCFAGEGLVNETEMVITTYLNNEVIE